MIKFFKRHRMNNLKMKLLIPILATTLIGLLVMVFAQYYLAKYIIENDNESVLTSKVEKLSVSVDSKLDLWSSLIESLAYSAPAKDMDISELTTFIGQRQVLYSDFMLLYLADTSGNVTATKGARLNIADKPYFKTALSGNSTVSNPTIFGTIITPVITISAPVYDTSDKIIGVIGGAIELRQISDIINAASFSETGYAYMISSSGLFIAYPSDDSNKLAALSQLEENYYRNASPSLQETLRSMENGESGLAYYTVGNTQKTAVYMPILDGQWSVAASISVDEITESIQALKFNSIFLTLVIVATEVSLLLYAITHQIITPLKQLQTGSVQLGEGQLDWRININNSSEEFKSLAEKFNIMAFRLEIMIAERDKIGATLKRNNEMLEERVRDRTTALAETNAELKSSNLNLSKANNILAEEIEARLKIDAELEETNRQLKLTLEALKSTQSKLIIHEKMAALGNLVIGVAHELNTPVGICITSLSYLEKITFAVEESFKANALGAVQFKEFLEESNNSIRTIKTGLNRTDTLIQSFKKFSVGHIDESVERIHMLSFINDTLGKIDLHLEDLDISIQVDCSPSLIHYSYPSAIEQIITSLSENAVLHGFTVSQDIPVPEDIKSKQIKLVAESSNTGIRLYFSDNGIGMPENILKDIFSPFFTTKRGQGSVGIGLSVLYNIITQKLGGSVTVDSSPGDGTSFTIELPDNYG